MKRKSLKEKKIKSESKTKNEKFISIETLLEITAKMKQNK